MKMLDRRLWRLIKNSKGQYFSILTVIVVGLFIYTALNIASISLSNTLELYYDENNFADLTIEVVRIPPHAVEELKRYPEINDAQGRHVFETPVIVENEKERVTARIISLPNSNSVINGLTLIEGDYLQPESSGVLVLQQFAVARGLKPGDKISFQVSGQRHDLRINGIVASPEFVYLMENEQSLMPNPDKFGVIYVSEKVAATKLGLQYNFNQVLITVNDNVNLEYLRDLLEKELNSYGVKRAITKDNQASNRIVHEEVNGLKKASSSVPLVFLGVAAVIITVMVGRMVKQDRMTIGVLKAMGYSNFNILSHYLKYALSLGILGSLIGITFGMSMSGIMTKMYVKFFNIPMLKMTVYYRFIFFAVVLSSLFCTLAGLWGARSILKISPAESMRPETPKTGNRIFLEKYKTFWQRISFSWKIVLRNTFRSKKRFVFITFGIALTYSVLLFAVYIGDVFDAMFDEHYTEFQRMDYSVDFSKPLSLKALHEFSSITNVSDIEPKNEFPFEFSSGRVARVVNIIGLKPDTVFYSFKNPHGQILRVPRKGILISLNLARILDVGVGDTISVASFIPDRPTVVLEVAGIVNQLFGINGYMNIETMNNVLLDDGMMTGVYINGGSNITSDLRNVPNIASIMSKQEIINVFYEFIGLIIIAIGFMVSMGGVLGFAIIYSATSLSIGERTREFSSLRVMGFSKQEIFNIIVKENIIMAIVGIVAGIPLGNMFLKSLDIIFSNELYTLNIPATLITYVIAAIVTIVFIIIAQLATRRKIDKLEFLEALKNRVV